MICCWIFLLKISCRSASGHHRSAVSSEALTFIRPDLLFPLPHVYGWTLSSWPLLSALCNWDGNSKMQDSWTIFFTFYFLFVWQIMFFLSKHTILYIFYLAGQSMINTDFSKYKWIPIFGISFYILLAVSKLDKNPVVANCELLTSFRMVQRFRQPDVD